MADAAKAVLKETLDEVSEVDKAAKWLRKIGEKMWKNEISRGFLKDTSLKRFEIEKDIHDFTMAFESIRDLKELAQCLDIGLKRTNLHPAALERSANALILFSNTFPELDQGFACSS